MLDFNRAIDRLKKNPCNLILKGAEREALFGTAGKLAAEWIGVLEDGLMESPDFKALEPESGKLGVEHAEVVKKMAETMSLGNRAVCVVRDAHLMNKELGNKLLKALEDGQNNLSVIFITERELLDTISSRCMKIEYPKFSIAQMMSDGSYPCVPALLSCDGSPELYGRIVKDQEFCQFLETFYDSLTRMNARNQLRDILKLTHALKEKDKDYLPDKLEEWQLRAFICMVREVYWHLMLKNMEMSVPAYLKLDGLAKLYMSQEAVAVYEAADKAVKDMQKKGRFTRNDFFELLMHMIPTGKEGM